MSVESNAQEAVAGVRGGRLDKRCHKIQWGGEPFREWLHHYAPSVSEVSRLDGNNPSTFHALADKLVLIGESSFADEGYKSVAEMPIDLFNKVLEALLDPGRSARPDGSCHA